MEDVSKLCDIHVSFQAQNRDLVRSFPNVLSTLERLRNIGIQIGMVTTNYGEILMDNLNRTGVAQYLDVLVQGNEVKHPKPHPEPVLMALERLNSSPSKAIMIGDTDYDVLAGRNAGTLTIGVTYGFHGTKVAESQPDFLVDDIAEILPIIFK